MFRAGKQFITASTATRRPGSLQMRPQSRVAVLNEIISRAHKHLISTGARDRDHGDRGRGCGPAFVAPRCRGERSSEMATSFMSLCASSRALHKKRKQKPARGPELLCALLQFWWCLRWVPGTFAFGDPDLTRRSHRKASRHDFRRHSPSRLPHAGN